MPWKTFLARVGAAALVGGATLTLAVFVGVRLAVADPGGPTRDALTYAGVLRERAGMANTRLTFVFNRGGGAARCTTTTEPFTPDGSGAFSVLVPLSGSGCPSGRSFFDGDNMQFDVRLGDALGEVIASNVPITPVPYARFADQAGVNNDCPAGYTRDTSDPAITPTMRLCFRAVATGGRDDVVRVGIGATAFWIDRYEASVFNSAGSHFGATDGTYPNLPTTGQWATPTQTSPPLTAQSRTGVPPSRLITWFQANEACRASGKRLPTGDEWLAAAQGTPDPLTASNGSGGTCLTRDTGPTPGRMTGTGTACISVWGAQDMIGNLWEWTTEWHAGLGDAGIAAATPWGADYRGDGTWNISSSAYPGVTIGLPAAAIRGGCFDCETLSGVFAIRLDHSAAMANRNVGFRCVTPR